MALQIINSNSTQPLGGSNQGLGTDQGDTWDVAVVKLNAMFADLYGTSGGGLVAGTGTATYGPAGMIYKLPATVNSGNTNTTQTLGTYTVPANTFSAAGQQLEVIAWGTVANNAAPKSIALNMGAASLQTATQTGAAFAWYLEGNYANTSATAENYLLSGWSSGLAATVKAGTDSVAITGTFNITVTMADASAASSNVSLLGFSVEYFR